MPIRAAASAPLEHILPIGAVANSKPVEDVEPANTAVDLEALAEYESGVVPVKPEFLYSTVSGTKFFITCATSLGEPKKAHIIERAKGTLSA